MITLNILESHPAQSTLLESPLLTYKNIFVVRLTGVTLVNTSSIGTRRTTPQGIVHVCVVFTTHSVLLPWPWIGPPAPEITANRMFHCHTVPSLQQQTVPLGLIALQVTLERPGPLPPCSLLSFLSVAC